jgi:hypothetical protein
MDGDISDVSPTAHEPQDELRIRNFNTKKGYVTVKSSNANRGIMRQDHCFYARRLAVLSAFLVGVFYLAGCGGTSAKLPTPTPTFTPAGGTYTSSQTVTIGDTATGSVFYCTTDGTTPTTSSPQCAEPTTVTKSETLSVIAVAPGMSPSAVASATYTINLPLAATPVISPNGGSALATQTVTITDANSAASIYYTTDGSDPSSSSTRLAYNGAFSIASSTPLTETIKAIAIASNYNDSAVASATFTITPPVATPTISSAATSVTYPNSLSVTLADADTNATIYYAIGSMPTTSSSKYTGAIAVSSPQTIYAMAIDSANGYSQSATATQVFTVTEATPTFSVAAGNVSYNSSVTINDADSAATITYTTDGSDPSTSSTVKTCAPNAAVAITVNETLRARAANTAAGYTQSNLNSAAYTVPTAPSFTGSTTGGVWSSGFTGLPATLTADTGAAIYYTTDGSTPSINSNVYSGSLSIPQTETVQAIAVVNGAASAVTSQSFTVTDAAPTFSTPTGSTIYSGNGVTITDADPNAAIYYTATSTGIAPSITAADLYTPGTAILVTSTTIVKAIAVNTHSGTNYSQSATASATYYPSNILPAPTISAVNSSNVAATSATYPASLYATLADSGTTSAICYTLDTTPPTASGTGSSFACTNGTRYTTGSAVIIAQTETLTAMAFDTAGSLSSSAATAQAFTIQEAAPAFTPASGDALLGKVSITDTDSGATIYYTIDGSTPSTNSTQYTAPIAYTAGETLTAAAIDTASGANYTLSSPTTASYTLYSGNQITGTVVSGSSFTPIKGATVALYAAGITGYGHGTDGPTQQSLTAGSSAIVSNTVTTASDGSFALGFSSCPSAPGDQLYLVASGGTFGSNSNGVNSKIKLLTALGSCSSLPTAGGNVNATATVNEVTTIASAYALSGFSTADTTNGGIDIGAPTNSGQTTCYNSTSTVWTIGNSSCNYPGLSNAFKTVNNLANVTGAAQSYTYLPNGTSGGYSDAAGAARAITPAYSSGVKPTLGTDGVPCSTSTSTTNGCTSTFPVVQYMNSSTVPQARINTLANILAACVEDSSSSLTSCSNSSTGLLDLTSTSDTLQAALYMAHNPGLNVSSLYALQTGEATPPYGSSTASTLLASAPNDYTLALSYTSAGLGASVNATSTTVTNGLTTGFQNMGFALDANGNVFVSGFLGASSQVGTSDEPAGNSGYPSLMAVFNNQGAPLTPPSTYSTSSVAYILGGYQNSSASAYFTIGAAAMAFDLSGNLWMSPGGVANNSGYIGALSPLSSSGLSVAHTISYSINVGAVSPGNALVDKNGSPWFQGATGNFWEVSATPGVTDATAAYKNPGGSASNPSTLFDSDGYLWKAPTTQSSAYSICGIYTCLNRIDSVSGAASGVANLTTSYFSLTPTTSPTLAYGRNPIAAVSEANTQGAGGIFACDGPGANLNFYLPGSSTKTPTAGNYPFALPNPNNIQATQTISGLRKPGVSSPTYTVTLPYQPCSAINTYSANQKVNYPSVGALDGDNHFWFLPNQSYYGTSYLLYLYGMSVSGTGVNTQLTYLPSAANGYTGVNSSSDKTLMNPGFPAVYGSMSTSTPPELIGGVGAMTVDLSGNIWMMNALVQNSTTNQGNALVEYIGAAAPTIPVPSVALNQGAIGTRP